MPNTDKLLEQRTTWLKACAALSERITERDDGIVRLNAAVTRAEERVASDRKKLEEMVAAERAAADDFLRDAEEPEAAQAKRFIEDQEKAAQPKSESKPADVALTDRVNAELKGTDYERRLLDGGKAGDSPSAPRDLKTGEVLSPVRPVAIEGVGARPAPVLTVKPTLP